MTYTTEQLLDYAYEMLTVCKEEQIKFKKKNKWLLNNDTMKTIANRLVELGIRNQMGLKVE